MLITHNMGVVADLADRVAVMYQGEVVEEPARELFADPRHEYTQHLLSVRCLGSPPRRRTRSQHTRRSSRTTPQLRWWRRGTWRSSTPAGWAAPGSGRSMRA